mmetsp:Transcript_30296/g.75243  ORF Transcript_30296/g.75243 Transcript_30296/m.75243 type:complete len:95 (+) Transcript_30296:540-824(+)
MIHTPPSTRIHIHAFTHPHQKAMIAGIAPGEAPCSGNRLLADDARCCRPPEQTDRQQTSGSKAASGWQCVCACVLTAFLFPRVSAPSDDEKKES